MGEHCVGRSTQKRLDPQVLLDPLEKQFNLPALSVYLSDFFCFQVMGVADKAVIDPGFRICITNQAQRLFDAFKPNTLVIADAGAFPASPMPQIFDLGIAFQTGDEKYPIFRQIIIPAVIGESSIKTGKGPLGLVERFGPSAWPGTGSSGCMSGIFALDDDVWPFGQIHVC